MTKEYNEWLNNGLKNFGLFILKTIAMIFAVIGILCITGTIDVQFNNENHNKQVYVDGVLVEDTSWEELNNVTAGINVHVNIDETTTLWNK